MLLRPQHVIPLTVLYPGPYTRSGSASSHLCETLSWESTSRGLHIPEACHVQSRFWGSESTKKGLARFTGRVGSGGTKRRLALSDSSRSTAAAGAPEGGVAADGGAAMGAAAEVDHVAEVLRAPLPTVTLAQSIMAVLRSHLSGRPSQGADLTMSGS